MKSMNSPIRLVAFPLPRADAAQIPPSTSLHNEFLHLLHIDEHLIVTSGRYQLRMSALLHYLALM